MQFHMLTVNISLVRNGGSLTKISANSIQQWVLCSFRVTKVANDCALAREDCNPHNCTTCDYDLKIKLQ